MIFTERYTDDSEERLYFRTALHEDRFASLSTEERERLVSYIASYYSEETDLEFVESLDEGICILDGETLIVDRTLLSEGGKEYPFELYLLILKLLMKRQVKRRKASPMPKDEELIAADWRMSLEEHMELDFGLLVARLVRDELLRMEEAFIVKGLRSVHLQAIDEYVRTEQLLLMEAERGRSEQDRQITKNAEIAGIKRSR